MHDKCFYCSSFTELYHVYLLMYEPAIQWLPFLRRIADQPVLGPHCCSLSCSVRTFKSGYKHSLPGSRFSIFNLSCFVFFLFYLYLLLSYPRAGYHYVILGEHNRGSSTEAVQVMRIAKVSCFNHADNNPLPIPLL